MRVLSVSLGLPYPPDDGTRIRTWNLLTGLARRHDVVALTWRSPEDADTAAHVLAEHVARCIVEDVEPVALGLGARAARHWRAVGGGAPPFAQAAVEARAASLARVGPRIAAEHARAPFDVVVAESDGAALVAPSLGVPLVVNRHGVFTPTVRQLRLSGWAAPLWPAERSAWRRFDRDVVGDLALATTEESAAALRAAGVSVPVRVVPGGVVAAAAPARPGGRTVAFLGTMEYPPNADAVAWFANEVLPRLRTADPSISFRVVGRGRLPAGVDGRPGVDGRGYVTDLAGELDGVAVGVVPLRAGMGIKNKTLELMAHGLPVVSTPAGVEGIDAGAAGILVAREASLFATAVLRLLDDSSEARRRGRQGRGHIVAHHGWGSSVDALEAALLEAAALHDRQAAW